MHGNPFESLSFRDLSLVLGAPFTFTGLYRIIREPLLVFLLSERGVIANTEKKNTGGFQRAGPSYLGEQTNKSCKTTVPKQQCRGTTNFNNQPQTIGMLTPAGDSSAAMTGARPNPTAQQAIFQQPFPGIQNAARLNGTRSCCKKKTQIRTL